MDVVVVFCHAAMAWNCGPTPCLDFTTPRVPKRHHEGCEFLSHPERRVKRTLPMTSKRLQNKVQLSPCRLSILCLTPNLQAKPVSEDRRRARGRRRGVKPLGRRLRISVMRTGTMLHGLALLAGLLVCSHPA